MLGIQYASNYRMAEETVLLGGSCGRGVGLDPTVRARRLRMNLAHGRISPRLTATVERLDSGISMNRIYHYAGNRDEVRRRVDEAMAKHAARFPRLRPFYRWTGPYRARAQFHVPVLNHEQVVELCVHPEQIEVRTRLPRVLHVFRPRILEVLDRYARVILDDMLKGAA
jgi:hypothetical protein